MFCYSLTAAWAQAQGKGAAANYLFSVSAVYLLVAEYLS